MGYDYARSMYTYDTLFQSDAPDWLYRAFYGAGDPMFITPTFSLYGFSLAVAGGAGAATLPAGSLCVFCDPSAGFAIGFDPMSFAVSIAINFVLSELLSCDQADQMVAMRKSNRLCTYLGSYCSKKFLGACLSKKEGYCCFNSRLARIINEQGRAQIGKGFGSPQAPNCTGFTPEELQSLDFGRMNLAEFYAEIQAKTLDTTAIQNAIKNRVITDPTKSYYGDRP